MYKVIISILLFFQGYIMGVPFSFELPIAVDQLILKKPNYIKSTDGINLAYYNFIPEAPDSILIFYHGGGAWSNRIYQYMAQQLCEHYNIGTYLFDIRGHGNSQGERGDAPSTEQVWQDISTAINFVSQKHKKSTVFLGGHSSGAGLILNYSGWAKHQNVSGYLLIAPLLGSDSKAFYNHSDIEKRFIRKVRLLPLIISAITNGFLFKHSPAIFFNYPVSEKKKDSYLLDYYTCAMTHAISPRDTQRLFLNLDVSCCTLIGELDEQFIPEKVVEFGKFAPKFSLFKTILRATHLSVVTDAVNDIAQWIETINKNKQLE